jgi:hypothetical protein
LRQIFWKASVEQHHTSAAHDQVAFNREQADAVA